MANHVFVTNQYLEKIEKIEKELLKLKKGERIIFKKPISLKGILKGVNISIKDIEETKRGLFKTGTV